MQMREHSRSDGSEVGGNVQSGVRDLPALDTDEQSRSSYGRFPLNRTQKESDEARPTFELNGRSRDCYSEALQREHGRG